jgi:hypothetical protein
VLGSAASCVLALWFSPRLALIALAIISFSRAIALGEMLRKFSLHSHRERARMAVEIGAP